jgi:hypothetical protein
LALVAAGVLAGTAAADTIPWIPGDGQDEDMPAAARTAAGTDVPLLHLHVYAHWVGYVESLAPFAGYINCPQACARPVEPGTTMTLIARKNQDDTGAGGLAFSHWEGEVCNGVTTEPCTFTMPPGDPSVDVIAVFTGIYIGLDAPGAGKTKNPPEGPDQPPSEEPTCFGPFVLFGFPFEICPPIDECGQFCD